MKRSFKKWVSFVTAFAMMATMIIASIPAASAFVSTAPNNSGKARVMIHDPSIVVIAEETGRPYTGTAGETPVYYLFGSHLAYAKSYDMMNWDMIGSDDEYEGLGIYDQAVLEDGTPTTYGNGYNPLVGYINQTCAEAFEWAGFNDQDSTGGYNFWAVAPYWIEEYVWTDEYGTPTGETGAWLLYYSASSSASRSCIGFAISDNIEGPYDAPAYGSSTVVYSGFTSDASTTKGVHRYYGDSQTLVNQIASVGGWNSSWASSSTRYNTSYAPNAIDADLIYEEETGKLYMIYGSWSGGIWALEIDPTTGLAIFPTTANEGTNADGMQVDRYFGTRLGLGRGQSGEGAYVVYDPETEYYYMWITYNGLGYNGGYNMREFRSTSVTGPYYDAAGTQLKDFCVTSGGSNASYGNKIQGNYIFDSLETAYMAGGQNSVWQDPATGRWYNVYHNRFNNQRNTVPPGGLGDGDTGWDHEVRVHELLMNEDGWLISTPYEYTDTDVVDGTYAMSDVAGTYQFINFGTTAQTSTWSTPSDVILKSDGSVTGAQTGTWSLVNGNEITITIGSVDYKGFALEQNDESGNQVMVFTALGSNREAIWGSRREVASISYDPDIITMYVDETLNLPTTVDVTDIYGNTYPTSNITWDTTSYDTSTQGLYRVKGTLDDFGYEITVPLVVFLNITIDGYVISGGSLSSNGSIQIVENDAYVLPDTVTVSLTDGTTETTNNITWDDSAVDVATPGIYMVTGTLDDYDDYEVAFLLVVFPANSINGYDIFGNSISNGYISIVEGGTYTLPTHVVLSMNDGSTPTTTNITWDDSGVDVNIPGVYTVTGTLDDYNDYEVAFLLVVFPAPVTPTVSDYTIPGGDITVTQGGSYALPSYVTVTLSDGTSVNTVNITWDDSDVNINKPGTYTVYGYLSDYDYLVRMNVTVLAGTSGNTGTVTTGNTGNTSTTGGTSIAPTGDIFPMIFIILVMVTAAGVMSVIIYKKRKRTE